MDQIDEVIPQQVEKLKHIQVTPKPKNSEDIIFEDEDKIAIDNGNKGTNGERSCSVGSVASASGDDSDEDVFLPDNLWVDNGAKSDTSKEIIVSNGELQNNGNRKRRHSATGTPSTSKTKKYINDDEYECGFALDELCDEMLAMIFQYVDTWALLSLKNCCPRFEVLVKDRIFWHHIDLFSAPLPLGIIEDVLERTHIQTKTVKLHGPDLSAQTHGEIVQFNTTLKRTFLKHCPKLTCLELKSVTLDFRHVRMKYFPRELQRLVFDNCNVRTPGVAQSMFAGLDVHLLNLEEFCIENCEWFEPYFLMVISKLPLIRKLSLKGCERMSEFVAYGSMAARFGFKKLEYLDLRQTPITDSDLQCFNCCAALKELYLEYNEDMFKPKNIMKVANEEHLNDCEPSTSAAAAAKAAKNKLNDDIATAENVNEKGDSPNPMPENQPLSPTNDDRPSSSNSTSSSSSNSSASSSLSLSSVSSAASSNSDSSITSRLSTISTSSVASSGSSNAAQNANARQAQNVSLAAGLHELNMVPRGNVPARSRFLNRPDHIIYLNFPQNREQLLQVIENPPQRRPANVHLEQVLHHPLFWQIVDPVARNIQARVVVERFAPGAGLVGEPGSMAANFAREIRSPRTRCPFYRGNRHHGIQPISDRGICHFGRPPHPVQAGQIWIQIGNRRPDNSLERLSVRNYKMITDVTLKHLAACSPHLVYLDLSGTSITLVGVKDFKTRKPECEIVADHIDFSEDNMQEDST